MTKRVAICLLVALALLAGCGSTTDDRTQADLEAAQKRVAELEAAASTTATPPTASPETTSVPAPTSAPTTPAPPSTVPPQPAALMPNVVCMNLQAAQDLIQSQTGIFYTRSEDATGAGRMQVLDSNWVVVSQRPAPGTPFGEGDAVLSAVKLGEENSC